MDVLYASNELLVNSDGCFLMEALLLNDVIEEFTIDTVLHDKIKFSLCLNNLVELDDVRVTHLL